MREWLAFATAGLLWGSSFLWIKIALEEISPLSLVVLRIFFGLLGLLAILRIKKQKIPRDRETLKALAILAFLSPVLPFMLISWAEVRVDSGVASILNGTVPLFTILFAHFFLHDEKFTPERIVGLVLGFCGVVMLVGRNLTSATPRDSFGALAVVGASIVYATSGIYSRRKIRNMSPIVQTTTVMIFAELWVLATMLLVDRHFQMPHLAKTWVSVIWLGLLGTCTAYLCYFHLLNKWGATRASLVNYVFPVVGLILGVVFRSEPIDLQLILGSVLVVSGILVVNYKR